MRKKIAINTGDYLSNGCKISDYGMVFDVYENTGQYLDEIKFYANLTSLILPTNKEDSEINSEDFKKICIANGVNILLGTDRTLSSKLLKLIEFDTNSDVLVFYLGKVLGKRDKGIFIKDGILFDKYKL